ncbi:unnamed protein product [Chrysoparadoxa australica]
MNFQCAFRLLFLALVGGVAYAFISPPPCGPPKSLTLARATPPQQAEVISWLVENHDIETCCRVGKGGMGRGLVTGKAVGVGDTLLTVPRELCLWATNDGAVSGLLGQTKQFNDATNKLDLREEVSDERFSLGETWDVRMALALLEATASPAVGGAFWEFYRKVLPAPHTATLPFCLPDALLPELQHSKLIGGAKAQQARLKKLYPHLMLDHAAHPMTGGYAKLPPEVKETVPLPLQWAFAMVRSRCFAAGGGNFAFVPVMDLANHSPQPNANFTFSEAAKGFEVTALKEISAGQEVTICYGSHLSNERLMTQYGFVQPLNPKGSQLAGIDADDEAPELPIQLVERLEEACQQHVAATYSSPQVSQMWLARGVSLLPRIVEGLQWAAAEGSGSSKDENECVGALLERLRHHMGEEFSTSLEQDEALQDQLLGQGEAIDGRLWAALVYRMDRKRNHGCEHPGADATRWLRAGSLTAAGLLQDRIE